MAETLRPLVDRAKPAVVVLDCRAVLDIEYTALKMLAEAERGLRGEGIELWLAGCNPQVLAVVRHDARRDALPGANVLQRGGRGGALRFFSYLLFFFFFFFFSENL